MITNFVANKISEQYSLFESNIKSAQVMMMIGVVDGDRDADGNDYDDDTMMTII